MSFRVRFEQWGGSWVSGTPVFEQSRQFIRVISLPSGFVRFCLQWKPVSLSSFYTGKHQVRAFPSWVSVLLFENYNWEIAAHKIVIEVHRPTNYPATQTFLGVWSSQHCFGPQNSGQPSCPDISEFEVDPHTISKLENVCFLLISFSFFLLCVFKFEMWSRMFSHSKKYFWRHWMKGWKPIPTKESPFVMAQAECSSGSMLLQGIQCSAARLIPIIAFLFGYIPKNISTGDTNANNTRSRDNFLITALIR